MNQELTDVETKKIYGAAPFEVDRHGYVYRRSPQGKLKMMKRRKIGTRWYCTIRNDHARLWSFDTQRVADSIFVKPMVRYTKQDILDNFDVKMIPDWARYVATPYGAIYCIEPPKRGRNAGGCFMLREFLMSGHPYVTLYHSDGTRRNKRVRTLIQETWGEDSALPDD